MSYYFITNSSYNPTMKYKSIFISDLHLGTKHSKADKFLEFIKENELLNFNPIINFIRKKMGIRRYWSLAGELKNNLRNSLHFIEDYENISTQYVKHTGYDGVICGHIHKADIKTIDGIAYMNTGDWVESCTALVETLDGEWEILTML